MSTIGITYWYISIDSSQNLSIKKIFTIVTQISLIGALITTLSILLIHYLTKKIKTIWLLSCLLFILAVIFIFLAYWFIIYMFNFELNEAESLKMR